MVSRLHASERGVAAWSSRMSSGATLTDGCGRDARSISTASRSVRYSEDSGEIGGDAVQLDAEKREAYTAAYERWRRDLDALHRVLLDGEQLDPPHFVALLRRESKSKDRYDEVRQRVLGLPDASPEDDPFGEDPFSGDEE